MKRSINKVLNGRKQSGALFNNNELCNIYRQLAEGMKTINAKLVHRDIKPENILVCGNDLKISDFGLAKVTVE